MSMLSVIAEFTESDLTTRPVHVDSYDIIAEGDSLTALPANGGAAPSWTELLRADLSLITYPYIQNFAVSGQAVIGNIEDQFTEIILAKSDAAKYHILIALMGINDIQGEVYSPLALYDHMKAYFKRAKSYNFKTIAFCLTASRATVFDNAKHIRMWAALQEYNGYLRAGFISGDFKANRLIDLQTFPLFGGYDTPTTSPYFLSDHLHYSTAGKTALKDIIKGAIDLVIAGDDGITEY